MASTLPPEYFSRLDESDDSLFYAAPRKVVHLDDGAIAALRDLYGEVLPPGGHYLDLMSSWRSHLPPSLAPAGVVGLGLNAEEMADNPQLSEAIIHDLNRFPELPFESDQFDAVLCAVSVQYLVQPIAVFREVRRVLKTAGVFIVTFSNRCFEAKAVAIWRHTTDEQHISLVTHYFAESGPWTDIEARHKPAVAQQFYISDPLYALWAHKQ
ncbi:MAG: class I SAM-dependent methyltransferase [Anaerolineae bacterium]